MNFPTSTVNVLPHLVELRKTWKDQDFRFTKEQQEEYDILLQARKERVKFFYESNRVQVGPKVVKKVEETPEEEWLQVIDNHSKSCYTYKVNYRS